MSKTTCVTLLVMLTGLPGGASAVEPDQKMLEALRPFSGVIGSWKGTGVSIRSSGWNETVESTWGFRDSDGRVSLNFYFEDSELFKVGLITYDAATETYQFVGKTTKDSILRFEGKPAGAHTLKLDRADGGKDDLDRLEIKLVRAGHKLIYSLQQKKGTTYFESRATVELFRQGTPLADFKNGPFCIVTGAAGRIAVEYQGQTYHVACTASLEEFRRNPQKYIDAKK